MENNTNPAFTLEGRMPFGKAFPIGLQHVLAMFVANITPIMILTGICNLEPALKANLVQNAMIIAGIGTLIQLFPIFKTIGSGLPIVMGISFTFLSVAIGVDEGPFVKGAGIFEIFQIGERFGRGYHRYGALGSKGSYCCRDCSVAATNSLDC